MSPCHLIRRRTSLAVLAALALGSAAGRASAAGGYRVSARQLQQALSARFPLRYAMPGLLELTLGEPLLHLLPQHNRLGTLLPLAAAGPVLRDSYRGELDLDFGLRYEGADQSIRAHGLRVQSLRVDGLPPRSAAVLQQAATELARQHLPEVVLHRLAPRDLALADTMGLQPGAITVTADGLLVGFVNKAAP
jgi:hypothetical protein